MAGASGVQAEPATVATASFFVSNEGSLTANVIEEVDLPPGWTPVAGEYPFRLDPGDTRLRVLGFRVPPAAPAGPYRVRYTVAPDGGAGLTKRNAAYGSVEVVVRPVAGLSIAEREVPQRVVAGEALRALFTVANHGNVPASVLVRARSSESYSISPDTIRIRLPAAGSRDLAFDVAIPAEARRGTEHVLKVDATTMDSEGREVVARSTAFQTVIALARGAYDPYHRVPSTLRMACAGGEGGAATQFEWSGQGRLTDAGRSQVDFLIRTPSARDQSALGLRDEYKLTFRGDSYAIRVGDATYDLSSLTVRRRYGRGGGAHIERGRWTLGGWRSRSAWDGPAFDDLAAYVRFWAADEITLGLNYLQRSRHGGAEIVSISAETAPLPSVDVDLEYASRLGGDGRSDGAYRARLKGTARDIRYFVERIRGGEHYAGLHGHEAQTVGSVDLPGPLGTRLSGLYRDYEEGQDELADYAAWSRERVSDVGLKRDLPLGVRAFVDWRTVDRRGQTGPTFFDYETRTLRVAVEKPHAVLSSWGFLEAGDLDNRLEGARSSATRYGFRISCRLGRHYRVSGHFQSALPGSGDPAMRNDVAGILAALNVGELELDAGFQWKGYCEEEQTDVEELTAGGSYRLPSGHRVSARIRWTHEAGDAEGRNVFRVSYDVPVGMRASRKQISGALTGTVFDAETPGRRGVENVVVLLDGVAAITDRAGRFSLPDIEPGEHYLSIDRASIGLRRVSTHALPLRVAVTGGRESRVDLGVAEPGRVEGRVVLDASGPAPVVGAETAAAHMPPSVSVSLVREGETLRCSTDGEGRFSFEDVRPGRWILTIGSRGVPPLYRLEQDTFAVEAIPGGESRVRARVVPVERTIPIIETGDLRVSGRSP